MSTADARNLAIVSVVAVAPLALVLLVALVRGYTIHLTMFRGRRDRDRGE